MKFTFDTYDVRREHMLPYQAFLTDCYGLSAGYVTPENNQNSDSYRIFVQAYIPIKDSDKVKLFARDTLAATYEEIDDLYHQYIMELLTLKDDTTAGNTI